MLNDVRRAVVMFSGGVDSTLIAYLCKLRGVEFIALTIDNGFVPRRELEDAKRIARLLGFKHKIIRVAIDKNREFVEDNVNRCYHCKKSMLKKISEEFKGWTIIDGTNRDDLNEFRPGLIANREFGVLNPLRDVEKKEIRNIARILGLPNWNKPSNSCLATRFLDRIYRDKVDMIERAEEILIELGFRSVRVRYEREMAIIEVGKDEIKRVIDLRDKLVEIFKKIGFRRVLLDLEGREHI